MASGRESFSSTSNRPRHWRQFVGIGYFSEERFLGRQNFTPEQWYRYVLHDFLLEYPQCPDLSWCSTYGVDVGTAEQLLYGCFVETVVMVDKFAFTGANILSGHMRKLAEKIKCLQIWGFSVDFLMFHLHDMFLQYESERGKAELVWMEFRTVQDHHGRGVNSCLDAAVRRAEEQFQRMNHIYAEFFLCFSIWGI